MNWIKFLELLAGVFIVLAIGTELRHEGLDRNWRGISPFMAIYLLMAIACLLLLGIISHNTLLTIAGSLGFTMSIFLLSSSLKMKRKAQRKTKL